MLSLTHLRFRTRVNEYGDCIANSINALEFEDITFTAMLDIQILS